jgi:integration host factor subunit alpha
MNQDDKLILDTLNELIEEAKMEDGSFTLTKAELAELLFAQVGLNKREAKEMVEAFFEEIRMGLESGDMVKLSGFGNFSVRDKASRPGRNPKTGEVVPISARRVVSFHASQKLKEQVEKSGVVSASA